MIVRSTKIDSDFTVTFGGDPVYRETEVRVRIALDPDPKTVYQLAADLERWLEAWEPEKESEK